MSNNVLFMIIGGGLGIAFALMLRRFFPALRGKPRPVKAPPAPTTRQGIRQLERQQQKAEERRNRGRA